MIILKIGMLIVGALVIIGLIGLIVACSTME